MKYLRGDSFAEKHWFELFQMLKMPTKTLAELKVDDFLSARHEITNHFKELKVCSIALLRIRLH
jgi:hypothetical protein